MFEGAFEAFVVDERVRRWMSECNPYATRSLCEDLLEAAGSGGWDASEESIEALRNLFLEVEGAIEDHSAGRSRRGYAWRL